MAGGVLAGPVVLGPRFSFSMRVYYKHAVLVRGGRIPRDGWKVTLETGHPEATRDTRL